MMRCWMRQPATKKAIARRSKDAAAYSARTTPAVVRATSCGVTAEWSAFGGGERGKKGLVGRLVGQGGSRSTKDERRLSRIVDALRCPALTDLGDDAGPEEEESRERAHRDAPPDLEVPSWVELGYC